MNDTVGLSPEVEAFVAAVRARFGDLDADEREDLLDGLEADMADLVAERGPEALGDPDAYAAELRSAAGLPAAGRARVLRSSPNVGGLLDLAASKWGELLAWLPADCGAILRAMRPAWWVFRAWLAVMWVNYTLAQGVARPDVAWLPTPSWGVGLLLLGIAAAVSVQIGRGKLWPGTGTTLARVVLLALNVFAVIVTFQVLQSVRYEIEANVYTQYASYGQEQAVTSAGGRQVCNLQAYDAAGQPLVGVQLFDETGRPFDVRCPDRYGTGAYPWQLGDVPRWNVFPQAERRQAGDDHVVAGAYDSPRPPTFPVPKRTEVPAVTHPLVAVVAPTAREDEPRDKPARPGKKRAEQRR